MLPTPSTSHVSFTNIYEPSEDSYLFLDTLASPAESHWLHSRFSPPTPSPAPLILEIGPGSGVILAFAAAHAAAIFGRPDILTLGVDVNAFACRATRQTVAANLAAQRRDAPPSSVFLDSVNGDLTSALRPHAVDVLLFNPPYVPSESLPGAAVAPLGPATASTSSARLERDHRLLALATDGGEEGMEITNRLLEQLSGVLSARGVAYVLLCAQNRPHEVRDRLRGWNAGEGNVQWEVEIAGSSGKTAGWEKLVILRIARVLEPT